MKAKSNIIFVLLVLLIVFVGPSCYGQNPPAPKASSDATLIRQVGKTGAFYFKKADVVKGNAFFYALGSVDDVYNEKDVITMTFSFQIPGSSLTKPEKVSVSITTKSRVAKYSTNHKLQLFADGKRIVNAETEITYPRREGTTYATEIFDFKSIKFEQLEKLAKAKKISVKFGETNITLGAEQQKGITDFYELFKN